MSVALGLELALGGAPMVFGAAERTTFLLPEGMGALSDFVDSDVVGGDHGTWVDLLGPSAGGAVPGDQIIGNTCAARSVTRNPTVPMIENMTDMVRRVSCSLRPAVFETTQKPLSFIQGTSLEAQPMVSAR